MAEWLITWVVFGSGSRCKCRSEGTPVVNQEREKGGVMEEDKDRACCSSQPVPKDEGYQIIRGEEEWR